MHVTLSPCFNHAVLKSSATSVTMSACFKHAVLSWQAKADKMEEGVVWGPLHEAGARGVTLQAVLEACKAGGNKCIQLKHFFACIEGKARSMAQQADLGSIAGCTLPAVAHSMQARL